MATYEMVTPTPRTLHTFLALLERGLYMLLQFYGSTMTSMQSWLAWLKPLCLSCCHSSCICLQKFASLNQYLGQYGSSCIDSLQWQCTYRLICYIATEFVSFRKRVLKRLYLITAACEEWIDFIKFLQLQTTCTGGYYPFVATCK